LEPYDNHFWDFSNGRENWKKERKKCQKQAGAEVCQAQEKLGLSKPASIYFKIEFVFHFPNEVVFHFSTN
jgi:hypothetical protein